MGNLRHFGYGIKSFTLSMLETAVTLANGHLTGQDVQSIINFAKEMVNAPTQLLEHVAEIVPQLAQTHQLMLLTKGDLLDQEAKLARSGLADYFAYVEVVSQKTDDTYAAIMDKYRLQPEQFLMVGNSLKSDVLPVVDVGGTAVYIPYHLTWEHEIVTPPTQQNYLEIEHIGQLPVLLETLEVKI
jgi:putative hydrolase of the HAD superfamily